MVSRFMYRRVTAHPERDDEGHGEGRRELLGARNGLGLCPMPERAGSRIWGLVTRLETGLRMSASGQKQTL